MLNASRRHCDRHRENCEDHGKESSVLNASRRHCDRHVAVNFDAALLPACSTPLGVTVIGTPDIANTFCAREECSTPLGVTVIGTHRGYARMVRARTVLNASRRHCDRHPG